MKQTLHVTPRSVDSSVGFPFEAGLFGINMEVTRKGFFSGLCAQMLNNRKLFMGQNGVDGWVCTEFERVLDRPEESLCQSHFVILRDGGSMTQSAPMTTTEEGREYLTSVWIKPVSEQAEITFGVEGREQTFLVSADGRPWQELSFSFVGEDRTAAAFSVSVKGEVAVYEVSLLPADHFHGMRRDVIESLRALGTHAIRYPGGCYADHFEWKESLKAPELRKPVDGRSKGFMLRNSYHQDCVEVGLNEFILLCRELGAEPEYTVSHLQSDGKDAAQLIEYCNGGVDTEYGAIRESLGFAPFGIKVWYIGNESYYSGGPYCRDGGLAGERTNEIVRAMRAVDPTMQAVIGLAADHHLRAWSTAFMEKLDCPYAYVSHHWYYGTGPTAEPNGVEACEHMKNTFWHDVNEDLDFYKETLLPRVWENVRMNIDEWNFCWGSDSNNALLTSNALQLHFFARNAEKYHIRDARVFRPVNEGMITVTPTESRVESSGLWFGMMAAHKGGTVIPCTADTENLDLLCTDHGDHLCLSVINRGDEEYTLAIEGYRTVEGTEIRMAEYSFTSNETTIADVRDGTVSGYGIAIFRLERTGEAGT